MDTNRVLVCEDDRVTAEYTREILEGQGYKVDLAVDGRLGLEQFMKHPYSVVITDFHMPHMDGKELIEELQKTETDPVIIMYSVEDDLSRVIGLVKTGIFNFILKPVKKEVILFQVERAFEYAELLRMTKAADMERDMRIQKQLAWHDWKDKVVSRDRDKVDGTLFHSLNIGFSQGAGFGSLISLLSLMPQMAKIQEDESYVLEKDFVDMLLENARKGSKTLKQMSELDELLQEELELGIYKVVDILDMLKNMVEEMRPQAAKKNLILQLGQMNMSHAGKPIRFNRLYLHAALRELLINGFKFSEENSTMIILSRIRLGYLIVSFMNVPRPSSDGITGIPPEYEAMVFAPFFRLDKSVDERYDSLDYGLGLTYVDKVMRKHHGKITASNVRDYLQAGQEAQERVSIEIQIPLA